jgi:hypothetical protein
LGAASSFVSRAGTLRLFQTLRLVEALRPVAPAKQSLPVAAVANVTPLYGEGAFAFARAARSSPGSNRTANRRAPLASWRAYAGAARAEHLAGIEPILFNRFDDLAARICC